MSDVISGAVKKLEEKLGGSFDGSARFDIDGEGSILVDNDGVRESDAEAEAEVVLTADTATFREMMEGDLDPTAAFMGGRLKIDGDMGQAMKLGTALS